MDLQGPVDQANVGHDQRINRHGDINLAGEIIKLVHRALEEGHAACGLRAEPISGTFEHSQVRNPARSPARTARPGMVKRGPVPQPRSATVLRAAPGTAARASQSGFTTCGPYGSRNSSSYRAARRVHARAWM